MAAWPDAKRFYDVNLRKKSYTPELIENLLMLSAPLIYGLMMEWDLDRVAAFANQLGSLVASRHGGIPPWTLGELMALET